VAAEYSHYQIEEMIRTLKGFLFGYTVLGRNGTVIGTVVSCLLDPELGLITELKLLIYNREVSMPISICVIDHEQRFVKIKY
jgi:hypothetical protein